MISVTMQFDDGSGMTIYGEMGIHWAAGTVIDALTKYPETNDYLNQKLTKIVIDPNASAPPSERGDI